MANLRKKNRGDNYDAIKSCRCRHREHDQKNRRQSEVKKHLENLGFVVGGTVTVIAAVAGNLIVNVKEARVAINEEMARKIMI